MVGAGVSADEPTLRAIAAHALRGGLDVLVDQAIRSDHDPHGVGFLVSPDLVAHLREQKAAGSAELRVADHRIGANEERLRKDLAAELDGCQLPRRNGPLVVVTRNTDGGRLRLAKVWRGLSRLVLVRDGEAGNEWHDAVEIALNFQGKDLSHACFSGADLRYADLSETNLSYADLSQADLRHANLSKANLSHANLKGADLRSTNFWRAFYFATEFQGAVGNKATTWPFLMTPIGVVERET
ncbi:MAG: pentapeptide repeat-containing protein [Chloroflexaceae bacterium]|nr:pentapeptide repeat-containing protein [Chloroflexaceae bacterium]